MRKRNVLLISTIVLALGVGAGIAVFTEEQEVPAIPGITAPDEKPNGCVSCHRERPDIGRDFRLSTYIHEWATEGAEEEIMELAEAAWPEASLSGKHPDVSSMVATQELPTFCLTCHRDGGDKPLYRFLHLVHFTGGEENHFITSYGGFCTQCHAVDLDLENPPAGGVEIKTGKEGQ
jgi:cytochrome c553